MMADPDAAIVKPHRVQCGRCERWIKCSNKRDYVADHWILHKSRCGRTRTDRVSELATARRQAQLEADPTINILEPYRALCNICNKVKCFIVQPVLVYTELLICTASGLYCPTEAGMYLAIGCDISEVVSHEPRVGRPRWR
jgi:hypothetical protein